MRCVQVLSTLALKRLLRCYPVGHNGSSRSAMHQQLTDSPHVPRALRQAVARAWVAVEVLLAGEAFWERAQLTWERSLETEFFQPLRRLLDHISLDALAENHPEGRRASSQALRAALTSTLLTSGPLDLGDLLPSLDAEIESRHGSAIEWRTLNQLIDHLDQSGYGALRGLLSLRCGRDDSLLVVLVAVLFRQAVEIDADLFGSLHLICKESAKDAALEEFRALALVLDRHRDRLDALLNPCRVSEGATLAPMAGVDAASGELRLERGKALAQRGEHERAIGEYTVAIQMRPASADAFLSRADANRLKGDYAQALVDYNSALRLDPANARGLVQRGQLHSMQGHVQEAIADYTASLQIDPKNALAYYYRGKALAAAGDLDGALVNFSEALRLDPFYAWAYHDAGEVHAAKKNYDRALADFSEALRLNPMATLTYLARGDAYLAKKEYDRAIADYGNVLRLDPHHVQGYLKRGLAYREQGQYVQAAAELSRAMELDFGNVQLYFERGLVFQQQGNHQRALLDFNGVISRQAKNAEAYFRRGLSQEALGDSQRALADLSLALRLDPGHAGAFHSRGLLYVAANEPDLALADFNCALSLDATLAKAYLNRAKILVAEGRLDEALADCHRALQNEPELHDVFLVRGSVLAQQGNFAEAVDDFSRTLQIDHRNAQVFYLRGVAFLKLERLKEAVVDLTEAIRLDPNHVRAYAQRAAIRKAAGHHKLALSDLAHATRLDAQLAPAYCRQLGLFHASLGMHAAAAADYTVALCLDPNNASAKEGRERAWQAYLAQPVKREESTVTVQQIGGKFPLLLAAANTTPAASQETATHPVHQETATHPAYQDTNLATAPLEGEATSEDGVVFDAPTEQPAAAPALSQSLMFKLNVPAAEAEEEEAPTADVEIIDADPPEPEPEPEEEVAREAEEEPQVSARQKVRGRNRRQRSARQEEEDDRQEDIRKKAEEAWQKNQDAELQKKGSGQGAPRVSPWRKASKTARKLFRKFHDFDDDNAFPFWKKSVFVTGGLIILYFLTATTWSYFSTQSAMTRPTVIAVSGKVVSGVDGQPLAEVMVRFHPQKPPGLQANAITDKDGNFSLGTFSKQDGAAAGPYVVTVEPRGRKAAAFIPPEFIQPEKSPLKIEVTRDGPNQLAPFKLKL